MKRVGLRELKNRLSHYVQQVRSGHEIQITDRGEVVAELLPPRAELGGDARQALAGLARRGLVSLGASNDPRLYRRMPKRLKRGELQRVLDEERGGP
ncbi:MAG: type II toxin-antitoxin system Phd/YefM family antitoxin [Candidatus Rokuibacteriota bacterium]